MRKFVYIVSITIFLVISCGLIDCGFALIKRGMLPSAILSFLVASGPIATVVSLYMGYFRKTKKWILVFVSLYWLAVAILALAVVFSKP